MKPEYSITDEMLQMANNACVKIFFREEGAAITAEVLVAAHVMATHYHPLGIVLANLLNLAAKEMKLNILYDSSAKEHYQVPDSREEEVRRLSALSGYLTALKMEIDLSERAWDASVVIDQIIGDLQEESYGIRPRGTIDIAQISC